MKYIYIAGPYSKGDPVENTRNVMVMAEMVIKKGYIPFIPHLTLFWHLVFPHEIDFWYDYDLAWLERCDCLLRLPGESSGADKEGEFAKRWKMPVYYSIHDLPKLK